MGACLFGQKRTKEEVIAIAKQLILWTNEELLEYAQKNAAFWHEEDLAWCDWPPDPEKHDKWEYLEGERVVSDGLTFDVYKRHTANHDPHTTFCYWSGNPVQITSEKKGDLEFEMVQNFFMRRIDLTPNWTPICTVAMLLLDTPNITVGYLRYEPMGAAARNILFVNVARRLEASEYPAFLKAELINIEHRTGVKKDYRVVLISSRSIPREKVKRELLPGEAFVKLEVHILLVDKQDGMGVYVTKSDAENEDLLLSEGLGEWITEQAYTGYVQKEAVETTRYMRNNSATLESDYKKYQQLLLEKL